MRKLRDFAARALDRAAELYRDRSGRSALEERLGDLELRVAMPLYFVTIYRTGRKEALYFTIVNAWDEDNAVQRADKRLAALTAQGYEGCVAAAFEIEPGHFYDALAAVHDDGSERHPYVEHPGVCAPPDACKTHGRCWTHSAWDHEESIVTNRTGAGIIAQKHPATSESEPHQYRYIDRPNEYDPPTPVELADHARRKAAQRAVIRVDPPRQCPHGVLRGCLECDWLAKIEALKSGDPCEYRDSQEHGKWLPGTVVENNLAESWRVRDVAGQVHGIYIESIRLPGQEDAWR